MMFQELVPLKASRKYIAVLDGLRAISILFVVIRHFEISRLVSANLGVTVFFFISGFIITRLMLAELDTFGKVRISAFYMRRLLRLLPALLLLLSIVLLTALALNLAIDWGQVFAGLFYYMNYYTIFIRAEGLGYTLPINHLWSLAVEEHYYLIFPLLFTALIAKPKQFMVTLWFLIAASLVWRLVNVFVLDFKPKYNYFATESRFETILWGALLALYANYSASLGSVLGRLFSVPVAILAFMVLAITHVLPTDEIRHTVRYTLQNISLFCLIGATLFTAKFEFARYALSISPMRFLGKISYSLYLWHLPIWFFLPQFISVNAGSQIVIACVLSLAIASISYYYFEKPIIKWANRNWGSFAPKASTG
jgi:peptidoglycan/LPS O-acetylase OafA/YrhL